MCIMMIKYRVHEVAKDLNVPNKEVLDILAKYVKEPKKHMTALEENELDIVFDKFTQDHAVKDFDAYFATRNQPKEAPAAEEEKPAAKPNGRQQEKKPQQAKPGEKKPAQQDARGNKNQKGDRRPAQQNAPKNSANGSQPKRPQQNAPAGETTSAPSRRVVDTRTVNVNIDKYNKKYDRLAYDKVKNETVAAKQKINQRSQRRAKGI